MRKVLLVLLFTIFVGTIHSQEKIRVVENSRLAKIVGRMKGERWYAITFGKTIFINCKKEAFFSDEEWVRHELTHVVQYKRRGPLHFLLLYAAYSIIYDYDDNPLENEAIKAG